MRLATTLSSSNSRLASSAPFSTQDVTAVCWHPVADEAFLATRRGSFMRVNGETGGVLGREWALPQASEDPTEEVVAHGVSLHASWYTDAEAGGNRRIVLLCITYESALVAWDVTGDEPTLLGESASIDADLRMVSTTNGLKAPMLMARPKGTHHGVAFCALAKKGGSKQRKHGFGSVGIMDLKQTKQMKRSQQVVDVLKACDGLGAVAIATDAGVLHIWRFDEDEVTSKDHDDTIPASAYILSPSSEKTDAPISSIACGVHGSDKTKLVIVHAKDSPEATLWGWSANFSDKSDAGTLVKLRSISTPAPAGILAIHPHLFVALGIFEKDKGPSTTTCLAVIELEAGIVVNNEEILLQRRLNDVQAKPPVQSKPKPPAAPKSKKGTTQKGDKDDQKEPDRKRRMSRFSFSLPSSKKKPIAADISAPLSSAALAEAVREVVTPERDKTLTLRREVLISAVSGSIVLAEPSLVFDKELFTRDVVLSLEASFLGSALTPQLYFNSPRSILRVTLVPQPLHALPMMANGAPMVETVLERVDLGPKPTIQQHVILKRAEATGLTILGVEQRRTSGSEQVIVRAAGNICLLPTLGYSRLAEFEAATDACFVSQDRVTVLMGRSYLVTKRFDDTKKTWERASMKIRLQLDARRVFSTPIKPGGSYSMVDAEEGETNVLLFCGLISSDVEFVCYSRNVWSEHQEEDLFMFLEEDMVAKLVDIAQPPTPQRKSSRQTPRRGSTQHFFPKDAPRSGSVAISAREMDELRQRNASLDRKLASDGLPSVPPATVQEEEPDEQEKSVAPSPKFIFERGERVLTVLWSPFRPETPLHCALAVLTTRRTILLGTKLNVVGEARESPTSAAFVARNTVAFTTLKSSSQVFIINADGLDAFKVQPMLSVPRMHGEGPLVLVACLPERLVLARIGEDRRPHMITRPYVGPCETSDWAVRTKLEAGWADEVLRTNAPLGCRTLVEAAKRSTKAGLAAKSLREMERAIIKHEDPEHEFGSLSRFVFEEKSLDDDEATPALTLAMLEQAGDVWGVYRECLSLLATSKHKDLAKRHLLRLAKLVRGGGSSALVQAIRIVLGNDAVNEVVPITQEIAPRVASSTARLNREDSAASQAAATAAMRSGESSRLKRRETLPHPRPSAQNSLLPLSREGNVFIDPDALVLEDDNFGTLREEGADMSHGAFHHSQETVPTLEKVQTLVSWYGMARTTKDDLALRGWTKEELVATRANAAAQAGNEGHSRPRVASEFNLPSGETQSRRFSFGGSDEAACVGYWRFEELEETEEGTLSLDSSRFGNHGLLLGESEYEDSAETCVGMELGGRRHPHALKTRGEGGMEVKLSDTCDLGPHQREKGETDKQSFTLEMWVRLGVVQDAILCERRAAEFPWKFVIEGDNCTLRFETKEFSFVASDARRDVGKLAGFWRHIALVHSSEGEAGDEEQDDEAKKQDSVQIFVDGSPVAIEKRDQNEEFDDEDETPAIRIGGEGFWGEVLEVRLWAVAREQWEIASMMETHLNLAERIPVKLSASKQPSTSPSNVRAEAPLPMLSPPPSASKTAKFDGFADPFDQEQPTTKRRAEDEAQQRDPKKFDPFSKDVPFSNAFEADDPFAVPTEEPRDAKWDYQDPQQASPHVAFPDVFEAVSNSRRGSTASRTGPDERPVQIEAPSSRQHHDAAEDPWRKIFDSSSNSYYYFNVETQESVWTDPRVTRSDWDEFADEQGEVYFYNRVTGETTWDVPADFASTSPRPEKKSNPAARSHTETEETGTKDDEYTDDEDLI